MDKIIMWVMAAGALLGGLDRIFGNRFGLGERFERGFELMGSTALSMAGILCLIPLLARLLGGSLARICVLFKLDPAMLGSLIAIDMGGYQLCLELAQNPAAGRFFGVVATATLGCTISFTIPIGMGMLDAEARFDFARGILFGLIAMPCALIIGGCMSGLSFGETMHQLIPVLLISLLILIGIWKKTAQMIRGFSIFARCISIVTTIGLMLGAFEYMTGTAILPGLAPIEDALAVVASIAIVMLGSLPVCELLQRILKKPLGFFSRKTGLNSASAAGLLIGIVSVLPAIALAKDMDRRGRIVNAAFIVCAASTFAAHLGFTAGVDRAMIPVLLASKLAGGAIGIAIALIATRREASLEIL